MNKIIKLFMIIFLFKGIIYAVYITPGSLGASPDDMGHISYIQYIVANKALPVYGVKMESYMLVHNYDKIQTNINLKNYAYNFINNHLNYIVQHPPLHHIIMSAVYFISNKITDNFFNIIYILRLVSVLYGILLIYVLGVILRDLNVHMIAQICLLSIVIFSPAIQYFFSTIGNDSLVILLATVIWMFYIKYIRSYEMKYFILYVIFIGLLLMTKYTGIFAVIATIPMLIYYTIKKYGYKKTIKILSIGSIIGLFIIGPYFVRNYIDLGNLVVTHDKFQVNYDKSIIDFIFTTNYFNDIVRHIILLIGHKILIVPDKLIYLCVILILILFILYSNKNILLQISIAVILIGLFGCAIIEVNIYTAYIITVFILMLYIYVMNIRKNNFAIDIPIFLSIIVEFITFFYTHYRIYLDRGQLGAMHGRYYYTIIFPVLYVLGYGIIKEKEERVKYLPLMILPILIFIEIHAVILAVNRWY